MIRYATEKTAVTVVRKDGEAITFLVNVSPEAVDAMVDYVRATAGYPNAAPGIRHQPVHAIKTVRSAWGLSLREAHAFVMDVRPKPLPGRRSS